MNPTQQKILDEVQTQGKATVVSVANALGITTDTSQRNLRFLAQTGHIHIAEQDTSRPRMPVNVYAYGEGEDVKKKAAQSKQDAARKAFTKRNLYDPNAPLAANNGWVSTIHSKDYVMQHGEHIKYMERFQPRPDHASAWLFNPPKVELQGNKYDQL